MAQQLLRPPLSRYASASEVCLQASVRHVCIACAEVSLLLSPPCCQELARGDSACACGQGWEDVRHAERVDPFSLVKAEIDSVSERLRRGILSGIPVLERAAEYFFKARLAMLHAGTGDRHCLKVLGS